MKLRKRIRIWLGLEELRWWDRDEKPLKEPVNVIQGTPLMEALSHRPSELYIFDDVWHDTHAGVQG